MKTTLKISLLNTLAHLQHTFNSAKTWATIYFSSTLNVLKFQTWSATDHLRFQNSLIHLGLQVVYVMICLLYQILDV